MKNLQKAEEFYLKSLKIRENIFNEMDRDVAISYYNLGALNKKMGNLNKAEEFHIKALKIREHLYGENHGDTSKSYNDLGVLYDFWKKYLIIPAFLLYVMCFPLILFIFMFKNRKRLFDENFISKSGFLLNGYSSKTYYW